MKAIKGPVVLAGDIGGTKINIGFFVPGKKRPAIKVMKTYPSRSSQGLENIILNFLGQYQVNVEAACFGIAGPVVKGTCRTTNLPWNVSEASIKKRVRLSRIRLINDLTATAMAIPFLKSGETLSLNSVKAKRGGNLALIAPGTGLGEALLVFQNGRYIPLPSEGGHADFSPGDSEEVELLRYLKRRWSHVSVERLLSGPGLFNIYSWLKDSGRYREPGYLTKMIGDMDPPKAITKTALERNNPLCLKAVDVFISILGAVSGNLALTGMATGGVYLGGGIPPKILRLLKEGPFMKAFVNKGRFRSMMEKIPIKVILNDKAALLGAALCASEK